MVQKWAGEGCSAHLGNRDLGRPSGPLTVPGVGVTKLHSPCPHGTPCYAQMQLSGFEWALGYIRCSPPTPKAEIQC